MEFTPELITNTRAYFREKHGAEITDEQAAVYLLSLANVYLAFARIAEARRLREGSAPFGPLPETSSAD